MTNNNATLLWVDDEIELLGAYFLFLEKKGYDVIPVTNGSDAIDICTERQIDIIFLDENMPGLSGLETLSRIKEINNNIPIVMVTKSEEENIMDQAIGKKIADYLIKPVNPNQILLTLKKHLQHTQLKTDVTNSSYQKTFSEINIQINDSYTLDDWKDLYRKLVFWELELSDADSNMIPMLQMQKTEANNGFAKFIKKHYQQWLDHEDERPLMSPDVMKKTVFPLLDKGEKVFFIVFDNLRYDQWRLLSHFLSTDFNIDEDIYLSILPTATQYARNAIFAGLLPKDIEKMFPNLWVDEDSDEGKNLNESPLIQTHLERFRKNHTFTYNKLNNSTDSEKLLSRLPTLTADLNVIVINFIDILSHVRTESMMIRELAADEKAYRSITQSWFRHSPISTLLKELSQTEATVIITTDHGSIRVNTPIKIIGDKNTNTNLRYKLGKNLGFNEKDVFAVKDPAKIQLPSPNLSTCYIFASGNDFFSYPNNFNYYVNYYKNTFQHGGISMEEMLIPLITMKGKK